MIIGGVEGIAAKGVGGAAKSLLKSIQGTKSKLEEKKAEKKKPTKLVDYQHDSNSTQFIAFIRKYDKASTLEIYGGVTKFFCEI